MNCSYFKPIQFVKWVTSSKEFVETVTSTFEEDCDTSSLSMIFSTSVSVSWSFFWCVSKGRKKVQIAAIMLSVAKIKRGTFMEIEDKYVEMKGVKIEANLDTELAAPTPVVLMGVGYAFTI